MSDRDKLLGIWKLLSWDVEFQDTGKREPLGGANPSGYLIFTPEGRMMAILEAEFGVEKSLLTTVHSYTASQALQDAPLPPLAAL